jgi:hypothetical protein
LNPILLAMIAWLIDAPACGSGSNLDESRLGSPPLTPSSPDSSRQPTLTGRRGWTT